MSEKTKGEQLQEKLLRKPEQGGSSLPESELERASAFCSGYKSFLDASKTEREAVEHTVELLRSHGYREHCPGEKYQPGDKIYYNNRGKALVFATMGTKPISEGIRLAASHIDSPRIDLKPCPLYEDSQIAYFKTHYYGGIKKYQWTTIPLALHGVVIKKDQTTVKVSIGEAEEDPVFCITDLLPHLGKEQMQRKLGEGIKGEELNILIGSLPFRDDKASEKVKLNIANILFEKYGILEEDFLSAELTLVPAFKARDVGLDRSMVGAYGHDDRVCAYTSLMAALDNSQPLYTNVTVLTDREEIGSIGNTGLRSAYLQNFIADLSEPWGVPVRWVLSKTQCLSADVNCALDPTFADVSERRNSAYVNYGVVITKYTGHGGKSGTSEASAEFMAKLRALYDRTNVLWQVGELGKVDQGGGGTVAQFIADLDVDVVDVGVPVLSMHAPYELVSKIDVYETYRAFYEFLGEKD